MLNPYQMFIAGVIIFLGTGIILIFRTGYDDPFGIMKLPLQQIFQFQKILILSLVLIVWGAIYALHN